MEVILYQPEIPQNTGNIVRTCAATGAKLTLVKPLGFSTSARQLKRAGLDYWDKVPISYIDDLASYLKAREQNAKETSSPGAIYFFSSHSTIPFSSASFTENDLFVFGSETRGLPPSLHQTWPNQFLTIPMQHEIRCLNLSNSVAIVLYEALRQTGYRSLQTAKEQIT